MSPLPAETHDTEAALRFSSEPHSLELTILMPCLNEAETVVSCVGKARSFLERTGIEGEVLVADNGSTDRSPELARDAGARVVRVEQKRDMAARFWPESGWRTAGSSSWPTPTIATISRGSSLSSTVCAQATPWW